MEKVKREPLVSAIANPRSECASDEQLVEKKSFVCRRDDCGKHFSKKWNLQAHERLHTGSTPFPCRLGCGQWYMWMSSRKSHELNRCEKFNDASVEQIELITRRKSAKRSRQRKLAERSNKQDQLHKKKKGSISKREAVTRSNTSRKNRRSSRKKKSHLPRKGNRISSGIESKPGREEEFPKTMNIDNWKHQLNLSSDNTSDCWSSMTEDVLDDNDIRELEKCSWQNADSILADISLPEQTNFTEEFLDWILPCKASR